MREQPFIWINGVLLPEPEARLPVADRGLLLGDGLFETLRTYAGRAFGLRRHLDRLSSGASRLGIPLPFSAGEIEESVDRLLAANDTAAATVRITLTRGPGPGIGLPATPEPHLVITARPLSPDPAGRALTGHVVSFPRNERSPIVGLKTLSYLECVLAREEARGAGADEALFLNTRGELAESAASNLFLVLDGTLATPAEECGLLPGITRQVVLELAADLGLPCQVGAYGRGCLEGASEAFLTNSLIEVAPLVALDGHAVGSGRPGPVTERLQQAYRERVAQELGSP